jgi:NADPH2:quinone reductase
MKAAVFYEQGSPEVLKYEEVPDPVCAPDQVVIRVRAISIEGGDTLNRGASSLAAPMPRVPHIIGYQAAGEIVEVGTSVSHLAPGQRVVTLGAFGSHAELRAVSARNAWLVPDGMDINMASTIPVPFGTAHESLFHFGGLQAGETVLVHGGAGAVGLAAIQLAKRVGARVITTASSDEKVERLRSLGVDHGINYGRDDFVAEVMKFTEGKGVDLVVDPVGGQVLQASLRTLAYRGRVALIGTAAREPLQIDVLPLLSTNSSIMGVYFGAEITTDRAHNLVQALIQDVANGELRAVIDRTYPLSEAAAAHAFIESRQAFGRVLLIP